MACDNCGEGWLGGCPACGLGICGEFCSPEDDCFHEGCYFDAAAHPAKCSLRHEPLTPDEWSALRSATVCAICGGPAPCLEHPDTLRLPRCPRCGRGVQEHTLYDLLLAAGGDLVPCPSCDEDHDPAGLCGRCDGTRNVPRLSLAEHFTLFVAIQTQPETPDPWDVTGEVWGAGGTVAEAHEAARRSFDHIPLHHRRLSRVDFEAGLVFARVDLRAGYAWNLRAAWDRLGDEWAPDEDRTAPAAGKPEGITYEYEAAPCACGARRRKNAGFCDAQLEAYDAGALGRYAPADPHLAEAWTKGVAERTAPGSRAASVAGCREAGDD